MRVALSHRLILGVFALIACPLVVSAQSAGGDAQPDLFVPNSIHNFGTVAQGDTVTHTFTIRNRGKASLKINRVVPSCGCTASAIDRNLIPAGEAAEMKVDFDTAGFSGEKVKTVRVYTNDPNETVSVLTLKGSIEPEVLVTPRRVFFGEITSASKPSARQQKVTVRTRSGTSVKIGSIKLVSEALEFEETARTESSVEGFVRIKDDADPSELRERLIIGVRGSKQRRAINVPIFASILGRMRVRPSTLGFGVIEGDELYQRSVRIENLSNEPLELSNVSCGHKAITAEISEATPGKEFVLTVTLDPKKVERDVRSSIKIDSSDENQPEVEISVYGILPPKI